MQPAFVVPSCRERALARNPNESRSDNATRRRARRRLQRHQSIARSFAVSARERDSPASRDRFYVDSKYRFHDFGPSRTRPRIPAGAAPPFRHVSGCRTRRARRRERGYRIATAHFILIHRYVRGTGMPASSRKDFASLAIPVLTLQVIERQQRSAILRCTASDSLPPLRSLPRSIQSCLASSQP